MVNSPKLSVNVAPPPRPIAVSEPRKPMFTVLPTSTVLSLRAISVSVMPVAEPPALPVNFTCSAPPVSVHVTPVGSGLSQAMV